jgi:hypothetical protein
VQIQLEEHSEDQRREISMPLKKHYWSVIKKNITRQAKYI